MKLFNKISKMFFIDSNVREASVPTSQDEQTRFAKAEGVE